MLDRLSTSEKFAAAAASCALAAIALWGALKLTSAPSYTDFVVGYVAWKADAKLQDLIAAPVFIAVIFAGFVFLSHQLARQKQQFGEVCSGQLSNQLVWWSMPFFVGVCSLILGAAIELKLMVISAVGVGFVAITTAYNASRQLDVSPEAIGLGAFAFFLAGLMPLEIALLLGRAPTALAGDAGLAHNEQAPYLVVGCGLVMGGLYAMRYPGNLMRVSPGLILLGQIGLPFLFIALYPAGLVQPDGAITEYETTIWLKFLVAGMVACGLYDVIRRYRKHRATANEWTRLLSPVGLFALLTAFRVGNTVAPQINPDDYHFGESLLGWWSYLHGVVPYVGYIPAHGLVEDDLNRFFSTIFYDGSAGSVMEAGRLSFAVLGFAAFISIYIFSGSVGLAFVSTLFCSKFSYLFLTVFLCLWLSRLLRTDPARWLSVWILTAPMVILGVPPQGLLLVAASGAMAAYCLWLFWRNPGQRAWRGIGASLIVLVALGLFTPLFPMLFGAIRYVAENGPINQVAYGIPWSHSWRLGAKTAFVFEAIRMSWVAVPIACLAIIYIGGADHTRRKTVLLPAVVILLFVLLLIPYSMGRIDPGGVSRPGLSAMFGWAVLLPVAAWHVVKPNNRCTLILVAAGMSAALGFTPLSFSGLASCAFPYVVVAPLKDGRSVGLANIGKAYVQDDQWNRLTALNALLNAKLAPDETYLDLTSRNAQYFYLNRRPIMAVTAPYNLVAPSQQKREVERLSQSLPRLALLEGANIVHDGGGLALRNPYLYLFLLDNYTPRYEEGFIIGYRKGEAVGDNETSSGSLVKNLTDVNWDRGVHRLEPAILLDNSALAPFLEAGMRVRIGVGEVRTISRVEAEGGWVWLDGPLIDPNAAGYPNKILIDSPLGKGLAARYRASLFDRALAISDFAQIPVAWGRSAKSLDKKMALIHGLDGVSPGLHDLAFDNGVYQVAGAQPELSFDISSFSLSGRDAGLLKFEFSCVKKGAKPRMQVAWRDGGQGPGEAFKVKFTAYNGPLIVPLDASPRWLMMENIKEIRIGLINPSVCNAFRVKNIGLFQRSL